MRVTAPWPRSSRPPPASGLIDFETREPSLEQTFLAQYGREAVEVNSHGH